MKKILLMITMFSLSALSLPAQQLNPALNKDSLLQADMRDVPGEKKAEILQLYKEGNAAEKEFLLVMLSMPRSSKKELISNIDNNYEQVCNLKTQYARLVPAGYTVDIEFVAANNLMSTGETIDLKIYPSGNDAVIQQEWNMSYTSDTLKSMLQTINWTPATLATIKSLLSKAHCVSIENGDVTTIGFARSGMGMYFYKLFDKDLAKEQITQYNNGCEYIFYKKNIVLEYGGGAIGSLCFPD